MLMWKCHKFQYCTKSHIFIQALTLEPCHLFSLAFLTHWKTWHIRTLLKVTIKIFLIPYWLNRRLRPSQDTLIYVLHRKCFIHSMTLTPNICLRSGSRKRKGMLDTWRRLGVPLASLGSPAGPPGPHCKLASPCDGSSILSCVGQARMKNHGRI